VPIVSAMPPLLPGSRTLAVASGLIGIVATLACASARSARRDDAPEAAPVAQAGPAAEPASAPACGIPNGEEAALALRWPVNGTVTSHFGTRGRRPHRGIDISAHAGAAVRAAAAGRVRFSSRKRNYGRVVILEHAGGYETVYAHNQDNLVVRGAHVEQGQLIAEVGSTGNAHGPHLHFEVRIGKRAIDPLGCLPIRTTRRD
jgi:lipoprotein NlpD